MNQSFFYLADLRRLNRKASLTLKQKSGATWKLLQRIIPHNRHSPVLGQGQPFYRDLSDLISLIRENLDWQQELEGAAYAVFDTETTGLRPFKGDQIMALGAMLIDRGAIQHQAYYQLVNPLRPISPQSKKITGISEEMLKDQPTVYSALIGFLQFVGTRILVAHNAPFDLAFLNLKLGTAIGTRIVNPVIDTTLLAAALYPNLGDYSLERLADYFRLDLAGRHTAIGDARITAELYLKLLEPLLKQGITSLPLLARFLCRTDRRPKYPLIY